MFVWVDETGSFLYPLWGKGYHAGIARISATCTERLLGQQLLIPELLPFNGDQ